MDHDHWKRSHTGDAARNRDKAGALAMRPALLLVPYRPALAVIPVPLTLRLFLYYLGKFRPESGCDRRIADGLVAERSL
jgi:hypothetical protein